MMDFALASLPSFLSLITLLNLAAFCTELRADGHASGFVLTTNTFFNH